MHFYQRNHSGLKKTPFIAGIVLLLLYSLPCVSQTIFRDDFDQKDPSILQQMHFKAFEIADSLSQKNHVVSKMEILENGEDTYLFFDGRFDNFYWTGSKWVNLYRNKYHGYNFMSRKFSCKLSGIYSYGGYGFWTNHGHIIQFDFGLGKDWNLLKYSKNLPLAPMFTVDQENCIATIFADSIYRIDIPKEKILSIQPNPHAGFFEIKDLPNAFETSDYLIVTLKNAIIEKQTGNVFLLRPQVLSALHKAESKNRVLCYIQGNKIVVDNQVNQTKDTLDVAVLVKSGQLLLPNASKHTYLKPLLMVAGFTLPLFFAWFWYSRRKREETFIEPWAYDAAHQKTLEEKLQSLAGETLSIEQLDELFGLKELPSSDTQRYKRFQYIREINQSYSIRTGKELIIRQRDPVDGRRFIYSITK